MCFYFLAAVPFSSDYSIELFPPPAAPGRPALPLRAARFRLTFQRPCAGPASPRLLPTTNPLTARTRLQAGQLFVCACA